MCVRALSPFSVFSSPVAVGNVETDHADGGDEAEGLDQAVN